MNARGRLFLAVLLLVGISPTTAADRQDALEPPKQAVDPLEADLQAMQGRWVRELKNPHGMVIRVEKLINGNHATITDIDPNGNIIGSRTGDFKLSRDGDVRTYTFSNVVVTAGANAGAQLQGSGSFLYRLTGDKFFEVWGLRDGDQPPPVAVFWQRLKPAADGK